MWSSCCSIAWSCPTLCYPMDCSTPDLPVLHLLPEFAQLHVYCIRDAIEPSHPLTPSSSSALKPSQHQGLFQWVSCSHQVTKILELQLQHQSFREYSGLISLKIDWFDLLAVQGTVESSPAPHFKGISSLAVCLLYGPALITLHDHREVHSLDCMDFCLQSNVSAFQHTV